MGTGRPPGGPRDGPGSDEKLTDDFFSSAGVAGKGREKQIDDFFFRRLGRHPTLMGRHPTKIAAKITTNLFFVLKWCSRAGVGLDFFRGKFSRQFSLDAGGDATESVARTWPLSCMLLCIPH